MKALSPMVDVSAIEEAWMRSHSAAGSANRRVPFIIRSEENDVWKCEMEKDK